MNDPIVDEVRKARDEYAARFNYDLDAMVADLREQEKRNISESQTIKDDQETHKIKAPELIDELWQNSTFNSQGDRQSRDELHERR